MGADAMAEERKNRRYMSAAVAHIVFDGGKTVVRCRLRDLSESGAAIVLATDQYIPRNFGLLFETDVRRKVLDGVWRTDRKMVLHECATIWRNGLRLGVRFLDSPEPGISPGSDVSSA